MVGMKVEYVGDRDQLERTAHTCPVHKSLHPDVEAPIVFHWPA